MHAALDLQVGEDDGRDGRTEDSGAYLIFASLFGRFFVWAGNCFLRGVLLGVLFLRFSRGHGT